MGETERKINFKDFISKRNKKEKKNNTVLPRPKKKTTERKELNSVNKAKTIKND